MSVTSYAVRIQPDKYRIVVLRIFIYEMRLCKGGNDIAVYTACLAEVGKYTVHVLAGWRQSEWLRFSAFF